MSKEWQQINILMVKVMNMKLPDITVVEFSEVVEDIFSCVSLTDSSAVRFLLITSFVFVLFLSPSTQHFQYND